MSTCATCDGHFYRGKEIAVVGGGDSAVEEATFLTRFASKVTLIHRRDALRASKIMQDRVVKNPKVDYAWNSVVEEVIGEKHRRPSGPDRRQAPLDQGQLAPRPEDRRPVPGDRPRPQHGGLQGPARDDPRGLSPEPHRPGLERDRGTRRACSIRLPNYGTATSVEGVFACGDVVDTHYRQAITAAGSGCAAAIDCEKWLESTEGGTSQH